jgi:hypothetical protein
MIAKFIPVSVALITAVAGSAAAHDSTPVGYPGGRHRADVPPARAPVSVDARYELRRSDLNRDGRVTLAEALQQGRRDFRYSDRDQNRALTPREVSWGDVAREDRDRNGWVSYREYQDAIRHSFYRLDTNRDGVLASYELRQGPRSGAWRR